MQLLAAGLFAAASLLLAAAPSVAQYAAQNTPPDARLSATPELSGSLPDVRGGDRDPVTDEDSTLQAFDFSSTGGLISSGCEDAQAILRFADHQGERAARGAPISFFDVTARVEPRFLRYSRLLN